MRTFAQNFVAQSREYLLSDFSPRIKRAIITLSDEQIWWRPNENSNSIGNVMLHLAGNVRQWIVAGVGGGPDTRNRDEEFDRRDVIPKVELVKVLGSTVNEAAAVLDSLSSSSLSEQRTVQGIAVTVGEAIYHVVEHFSMHTGQILYIAKALTGNDLHMYGFDEKGNAKTMW